MHPTLLLLLSLAALAPALPMNQAGDGEYISYEPYVAYTPYSAAVEEEAAKAGMAMHKRLDTHSQGYGSYDPYQSYGRYSSAIGKRHMPMALSAEPLDPAMMGAEAKRSEDIPSKEEMGMEKEGGANGEKGKMLPDAWYGKYTPYSTYSPYSPAVEAQAGDQEE